MPFLTRSDKDALKAAAYTFLWTFVGVFAASLLGWLQDLTAWATDDGGTVVFPDPGVLVKAAVAAVSGAFAFVAAAIVRVAQAHRLAPGTPPSYPPPRT